MLTWDESKINIKKSIISPENNQLSLISINSKNNTKWPNMSINIFMPENITIKLNNNSMYLKTDKCPTGWTGMTNTISTKITNYIKGLEHGHSLKLTLSGVGYNLELKDSNKLFINIGYKDNIQMDVPQNILVKNIEVNKNGNYEMTAESFDLELLSQWLNKIKQLKPSYKDKYKGKGFS